MLAVCAFLSLLLTALLMGTTLAHTLELAAKLSYDGPQWVHLQQTLYRSFASIGGAIELASILAVAIYAYLARADQLILMIVGGALLLLVAAFGVWLLVTAPVNAKVLAWTATTIPQEWTELRQRWEYSHAARFALHLLAFSTLLASVLVRTRT